MLPTGKGGTPVARVGISVGGRGPWPRWHRAGTGRAAELASEAARAEGASPPSHRPWPAASGRPGSRLSAIEAGGRTRRLSGAAFGGRLIQQPTSPAVPSRLTLGHRCRNCTTGPRASLVASMPGGDIRLVDCARRAALVACRGRRRDGSETSCRRRAGSPWACHPPAPGRGLTQQRHERAVRKSDCRPRRPVR
jgi:hypothetical protein